jgi:hypothetical protein
VTTGDRVSLPASDVVRFFTGNRRSDRSVLITDTA